jgi:hypothetical protein
MANLHPKTKRLIQATRIEAARVRLDIKDKLPAETADHIAAVLIAQNTIRPCLEATLKELTPFGVLLLGELAIRLASYAISAAPADIQGDLLQAVMNGLPDAHALRMSKGIALRSVWDVEDAGPAIAKHHLN